MRMEDLWWEAETRINERQQKLPYMGENKTGKHPLPAYSKYVQQKLENLERFREIIHKRYVTRR